MTLNDVKLRDGNARERKTDIKVNNPFKSFFWSIDILLAVFANFKYYIQPIKLISPDSPDVLVQRSPKPFRSKSCPCHAVVSRDLYS